VKPNADSLIAMFRGNGKSLLQKAYMENLQGRKDMDDTVADIISWLYDRNLIDGSNNQAQFVKLAEEQGELAGAIARGQPIQDHAGDIMVVLIGIMEREGTDMLECLQVAYEDIKDRRGKMQNGVFIKEEDL